MVGRVFLDTTVLVGGLIEIEERSASQVILTSLAEGRLRDVATAWHCCLEFFAVTTRLPEEFRLTPAEAVQLLEEEVLGRMRVLALPTRARSAFLSTLAREGTAGGRVYDAHIAEIARHGDARTVVTDNRRHFTSLLAHGIRVLTASEFAAEL